MRWLIGDVHGMLRPLETLQREIERADSEAALYFVGDYVNRGPQSKEVISLLLTLKNARFIRGNHDDVLDQILHGISYAENASRGDRLAAYAWFANHGLIETLQSYGATLTSRSPASFASRREALQAVIDLFPGRTSETSSEISRFYIEDKGCLSLAQPGKWPIKEFATPATTSSAAACRRRRCAT